MSGCSAWRDPVPAPARAAGAAPAEPAPRDAESDRGRSRRESAQGDEPSCSVLTKYECQTSGPTVVLRMKFHNATSTTFSPSPVIWLGVAVVVLFAGEAALLGTALWLAGTALPAGLLAFAAWRTGSRSGQALSLGLT